MKMEKVVSPRQFSALREALYELEMQGHSALASTKGALMYADIFVPEGYLGEVKITVDWTKP